MNYPNAFAKVEHQAEQKKSRLILGLDEVYAKYSLAQLKNFIDVLAEHIVGVKMNLAFAEKFNRDDYFELMRYLKEKHPDLVRIEDAKRGDIKNTQKFWADADMHNSDPDIVTVTSWMGQQSTITPWMEINPYVCVFSVVASSERGDNDEDIELQEKYSEGLKNYQHMALMIRKKFPDRVGCVVGATRTDAAENIRAVESEYGMSPSLFLAPGLGTQGGDISFAARAGKALYPLSSGIMKAADPVAEAIKWKNAINAELENAQPMNTLKQMWVRNLYKDGVLFMSSDETGADWKTLAAGGKSPSFWDFKKAGHESNEIVSHLGAKSIKDIGAYGPNLRIMGVTYGGINSARDIARNLGVDTVILRSENDIKKDGHGAGGQADWMSGKPILPGSEIVTVEDVVTTSKSSAEQILRLRTHLENAGLHDVKTDKAICFMLRKEEGAKRLADIGVTLHSLMTPEQALRDFGDKNNPAYQLVMRWNANNR